MENSLRLLAVLAHPDDESLGMGSTLARYAAEGVQTFLLCATRGERGWTGDPAFDPGPEMMGRIRESELRCAATALGLKGLKFLGYIDGEVDQVDPVEAAGRIAEHIRRVRPQVVVSFGLEGAYGHPDHIAVAQYTAAAIVEAAAGGDGQPAHCVSKYYHMVSTEAAAGMIQELFGGIDIEVNGVVRKLVSWPEWALSAVLDNRAYIANAIRAIQCHQSQIKELGDLDALSDEHKRLLAGQDCFLRVFSRVSGGRKVETDLFEGLR